jgi:hypothetical protein
VSRYISFSANLEPVLNQTKTVTRRLNWKALKPNTVLIAAKKTLGLKKGETIQTICKIQVIRVTREKLNQIQPDDLIKEGHPDWTQQQFIQHFCQIYKIQPDQEITRIEFRYLS